MACLRRKAAATYGDEKPVDLQLPWQRKLVAFAWK